MNSESFLDVFARVSRLSKEACGRELQRYGIHVGQNYLLALLWETPEGLTVGELADQLAVEAPSITRTVQRMARQGLVEKHPHPTDARVVIVKLTAKGQALKLAIPQVLVRFEEQMLAGISDVERAFLLRLLKQMLENVEAVPPPS
ncbi:MAG: MarR family transcriptional regulator [Ktedonobacteraceae bacterium]|nr:MarR family transcriptional regulator [Ktedonobacteraceae bacterium]